MTTGNFKVGANLLVQIKNAPPPDMTMIASFVSKVVKTESISASAKMTRTMPKVWPSRLRMG